MRDFRFFSTISECYLHRFLLMVQNFGAIPARARRFFAFTPGAGPGFFGGNNENARRPIMAPGAIPLLHFCKYPIAAAESRPKFLLASFFRRCENRCDLPGMGGGDPQWPRLAASLARHRFLRFVPNSVPGRTHERSAVAEPSSPRSEAAFLWPRGERPEKHQIGY